MNCRAAIWCGECGPVGNRLLHPQMPQLITFCRPVWLDTVSLATVVACAGVEA